MVGTLPDTAFQQQFPSLTSPLTSGAVLLAFLYTWNHCCLISRIPSLEEFCCLFLFLKWTRMAFSNILLPQSEKSMKTEFSMTIPLKLGMQANNRTVCHILPCIFPLSSKPDKTDDFSGILQVAADIGQLLLFWPSDTHCISLTLSTQITILYYFS